MAVGFFDLTRIYFSLRANKTVSKMDYEQLLRVLEAEIAQEIKPPLAWSSADPSNEHQQNFLNVLEQMGFHIRRKDATQASTVLPHQDVRDSSIYEMTTRFDAEIGFALGRFCDQDQDIVVVSDSWALEPVLRSTLARIGDNQLYLAAFQDRMDPRWASALYNLTQEGLKFINLDDYSEAVLNKPRVKVDADNQAIP